MLDRLLWLVLDQDASFLPLHVEEGNLRTAVTFAEQYTAEG